ncbi:MAG: EAL domain-containing protein [Negativicutes bacterium]|nr:EAL domain-containing protein [Negativicutes bacterium]
MMNKKSKWFKSIRTRFIGIMAVMLILTTGMVYLILHTVMQDKINILEDKYIIENVERTKKEIFKEIEVLDTIVMDWAVWDNSYQFMIDKNPEYIKANLSEDTLNNLKINIMLFIDNKGNLVHGEGYDLQKKESVPIDEALLKYIKDHSLLQNNDVKYRKSGIVTLNGKDLILLSICPILTSAGEGPINGYIVLGANFTEKKIADIGEELSSEIKLTFLKDFEYDRKFFDLKDDKIQIDAVSDQKIIGRAFLDDIDGKHLLLLSIEKNRDINNIGEAGIKATLWLLLGLFFLFAIIITVILDRGILLRFQELSNDIRKIGEGKDLSVRLKRQNIDDELTDVSNEINGMLGALERSQLFLSKSESALKKSIEKLQDEVLEHQKTQEQIKYIAYHDTLTGLPNRNLLNELLVHSITLAERNNKCMAVLFLDIDGFKMINDSKGHGMGDQILQEVAERLLKTLRKSDVIARHGGDEFIVIIEELDNCSGVELIANKIVNCFQEPFHLENQDYFLTTSVGVAVYPADGQTPDMLIKNADIAMYKAKENGKNQYLFCTPVMKDVANETMELSTNLYRAIEKNELELYYQPQLSCHNNQIMGVEALIRWRHPVMGLISPAKFIPIAEKTGLILPIGEWVLRTACQQNKKWQEQGLPKIRMGVNLSLRQFHNNDLLNLVEAVLKETKLAPQYLELEITETIAMKEKSYIINTLNAFRQIGVSIAIDDFGTEYSSLSYLKHLPVDRLKVAMQFIRGIGIDHKDEALAKGIIVLAKSIGMNVIAEGVETKEQLEFLKNHNCDEIQGYYFFKPLAEAEMTKLLITYNK